MNFRNEMALMKQKKRRVKDCVFLSMASQKAKRQHSDETARCCLLFAESLATVEICLNQIISHFFSPFHRLKLNVFVIDR